MKQTLFTSLLFLATFFSFAQTQLSMNEDAAASYRKADKELNTTYNKVLKEYKSDVPFIKNLKVSQNIWIKFRDAEMKTKYPDREPGYYGSIQPTCWYNYLAELTKKRTKDLKVWLKGVEEGDSCAGSIKTK